MFAQDAGGNVIASPGYDASGRRSSLALGSGGAFNSSSGYTYDRIGRLSGLSLNLAAPG